MKKIWIAAAATLIVACGTQEKAISTAQTETNSPALDTQIMVAAAKKVAAPENPYGQELNGNLHGLQNKASFMNAPYNNWFTSGYDNYTPDAETTAALKKAMKGVTVKAFMGTWCGDSQRETPHFYKLMDAMDMKEKNITMISVDRSKSQPVELVQGNDVKRVPTFIFYKNGAELGRYVEYARESMEKDFLKIVTGQEYKHAYQN